MELLIRESNWVLLLLPCWLAIALTIRIIQRDRFQLLLGHLALGVTTFLAGLCGYYLFSTAKVPFGAVAAVGAILFCLGNALFWGWIVSPGGCQFVLTPWFLLPSKSSGGLEQGEKEASFAYWSKFSTIMSAIWFMGLLSSFVWGFIKIHR